jgi:hypothetical protein
MELRPSNGQSGSCATGKNLSNRPEVGFGEVSNILASLVVRRGRLRQASGCRSFFLSPSILGNDNVLYHSLSGLASGHSGRLPQTATIRSLVCSREMHPLAFLDPSAFIGTNLIKVPEPSLSPL